jgi:hypothetical protein
VRVGETGFATGPCTAAVINLDGTPTIRVRQGSILVGYYRSPSDIPPAVLVLCEVSP